MSRSTMNNTMVNISDNGEFTVGKKTFRLKVIGRALCAELQDDTNFICGRKEISTSIFDNSIEETVESVVRCCCFYRGILSEPVIIFGKGTKQYLVSEYERAALKSGL